MITINGKDRKLIVVSNRLPFYREQGSTTWKKAAGGLITAFEPILLEAEGLWLGWDGCPSPNIEELRLELHDPQELFPEGEAGYRIGCIPITDKEVEQYYNKISNGTLWALFHYFFEKSAIDYTSWQTYKEVNKRFAAYINEAISNDDVVWIQDYHLFLVPYYLRKLRPKHLDIHFFLHIPFPHIDIFSILPWQREITKSLLCCNTIGFHHEQYLNNFEEAVARYMDESHELVHHTQFFVNPISIDFDKLDKKSREPAIVKRRDQLRKSAGCPKFMIGIDRIDYSKGLKQRLLALELLLKEKPELRGEFFYYQLVVPSRESVESYQELKKEIDEIVGRIDGCYSTDLWDPIHYHYGTVPFDELVALYLTADIAIVTPLRDGMNLVCKEFVAAHSDDDGVLILSKFAGAYSELDGCLAVNPYSIEEIKDAIYLALHMPEEDRRQRMIKMREKMRSSDINVWLKKSLEQFEKQQNV